jgi:hypothetical protein
MFWEAIMSKLNRTNFLETASASYGKEKVLTSNDFMKYKFIYPMSYYRISNDDVGRPDIISLKLYKSIDFWWMLMKYNEVDDVWNELYPGLTLKVPDVRDFNMYANKYGT